MNDFLTNVIALAPLLIICATIVAVIGTIAVGRHHFTAATITVVGLNAALISLLGVLQVTPLEVTPLFIIDNYSVLFGAIVLVASLACSMTAARASRMACPSPAAASAAKVQSISCTVRPR